MFDLLEEISSQWQDYGVAEKAYWIVAGTLFAIGFIAFSWWFWAGMFNATDSVLLALGLGVILYFVLGMMIALVTAPLMTALSLGMAIISGAIVGFIRLCRQVRI